jgi:hypothetical protein
MPRKFGKWIRSGLYSHKSAAENAATYWHNRGYEVTVKKAFEGGWVHYRRKR